MSRQGLHYLEICSESTQDSLPEPWKMLVAIIGATPIHDWIVDESFKATPAMIPVCLDEITCDMLVKWLQCDRRIIFAFIVIIFFFFFFLI